MPFNIDHIFLFCASTFILSITPGPDILYVLSVGVTQGMRASLAASLGFSLGLIFHTIFVAFGISVLVSQSALLFTIVQFLGAFYLCFLGIKFITSKALSLENKSLQRKNASLHFRRAFFMSLINPKLLLFFLSFFPQFIDINKEENLWAIFFLGILFFFIALFCFTLVGLFASRLNFYLNTHIKLMNLLGLCSGLFLIGIGISILKVL